MDEGGAGLSLRTSRCRRRWRAMGGTRSDLCVDAEFVRWVKENEEARRLTTSLALARPSPRR